VSDRLPRDTPPGSHVVDRWHHERDICGHSALWLGVIAFTGTVTTRYQAAIPVGEQLIGRVNFEGREGRKIFVNASLTSAGSGLGLATAKAILIAAEMRNLEERGVA
jgi:hypothetical protein